MKPDAKSSVKGSLTDEFYSYVLRLTKEIHLQQLANRRKTKKISSLRKANKLLKAQLKPSLLSRLLSHR